MIDKKCENCEHFINKYGECTYTPPLTIMKLFGYDHNSLNYFVKADKNDLCSAWTAKEDF